MIVAELLLHLKTAAYISNTCSIYCTVIYISYQNLCNNHRKAPALETLFNKVLVLQTSNFIKK